MVNPIDSLGLGFDVPKAAREGDLGQEDFMHLMLTQLRNQDPFKPMESGEFLGQLAQFGTVQGLAGLQTSFDSLGVVARLESGVAGVVARWPHRARGDVDTVGIAAGQPVAGAVDLPAASASVTLPIRDALGQPVRTLQLGAQPEGLVAVRVGWARPTPVRPRRRDATPSVPRISPGRRRWPPIRCCARRSTASCSAPTVSTSSCAASASCRSPQFARFATT